MECVIKILHVHFGGDLKERRGSRVEMVALIADCGCGISNDATLAATNTARDQNQITVPRK
jgi:hypothetical protein